MILLTFRHCFSRYPISCCTTQKTFLCLIDSLRNSSSLLVLTLCVLVSGIDESSSATEAERDDENKFKISASRSTHPTVVARANLSRYFIAKYGRSSDWSWSRDGNGIAYEIENSALNGIAFHVSYFAVASSTNRSSSSCFTSGLRSLTLPSRNVNVDVYRWMCRIVPKIEVEKREPNCSS